MCEFVNEDSREVPEIDVAGVCSIGWVILRTKRDMEKSNIDPYEARPWVVASPPIVREIKVLSHELIDAAYPCLRHAPDLRHATARLQSVTEPRKFDSRGEIQ
jgi:hypothetical protein